MEYKGKLYGKAGNKYFDTGHTTDEWDKLQALSPVEAQTKELIVKEFTNITGDNESDVNTFLKKIGNRAISVTPLYNTILGGIIYVITYHE